MTTPRRVAILLTLLEDSGLQVQSQATAAELARAARQLKEYAAYLAEREARESG